MPGETNSTSPPKEQSKDNQPTQSNANNATNATATATASASATAAAATTTTTVTRTVIRTSVLSEEQMAAISMLRGELNEMRQKERQYVDVHSKLMTLEESFKMAIEEKQTMHRDFEARIQANLSLMTTLRQEIDDQKNILEDKKLQTTELVTEYEQHKEIMASRTLEISKLRAELSCHQDLNSQLLVKKKQLEEELSVLRERNSSDVSEINQLNYDISSKTSESNQLIAEAQSLEFQISSQKAKIDDMNRLVETRTTELKSKDTQVIEMEAEIVSIKNQVVSFENELNHLRSLEDKYKFENSDLQMRIDGESGKNNELNSAITDLQVKIRQKEDHIGYLKQELSVATSSNTNYVDTSSSLKVEIDSLNQHISIITQQNDELTRELDSFVKANEEIRMRLDRKARVNEVMQTNEAHLQASHIRVATSRSPVRQRIVTHSPVRVQQVHHVVQAPQVQTHVVQQHVVAPQYVVSGSQQQFAGSSQVVSGSQFAGSSQYISGVSNVAAPVANYARRDYSSGRQVIHHSPSRVTHTGGVQETVRYVIKE